MHGGAFGIRENSDQSLHGAFTRGGHGTHGRALDHRIWIIEKGSEEIGEGNWIPDQGEGFGGGTAHGHIGVASQGLA